MRYAIKKLTRMGRDDNYVSELSAPRGSGGHRNFTRYSSDVNDALLFDSVEEALHVMVDRTAWACINGSAPSNLWTGERFTIVGVQEAPPVQPVWREVAL